jgi:hypothetical protein
VANSTTTYKCKYYLQWSPGVRSLGDRDACMISRCDERGKRPSGQESCRGAATWAEWTEVMNIRSYATASDWASHQTHGRLTLHPVVIRHAERPATMPP